MRYSSPIVSVSRISSRAGRNAFEFTEVDQVRGKNSVAERRQFLGDALAILQDR